MHFPLIVERNLPAFFNKYKDSVIVDESSSTHPIQEDSTYSDQDCWGWQPPPTKSHMFASQDAKFESPSINDNTMGKTIVHQSMTVRNERPKSSNIMIKQDEKLKKEFSIQHETSAEMYDWATWQMYHRITSARSIKSPVKTSTNQSSVCAAGPRSVPIPKGTNTASTDGVNRPKKMNDDEWPTMDQQQLEGEVFEIEI
eukprot:CAMPEP_0202443998 /NCGR_PEP_ID=MMETSP1360-20130828/3165_1 /ASSEMBLY_ACC=CAM_ASM_000848 /TAXON_ID=515479 /ORGANISM="Licmophora paradoxa, Strain CCMP2313" /LENGTH=198 /DNA_ID=CAMNT_0049059863 /DNA_START=708 /DNA_END=1304 /DNA_ORIENTATION=+